MFPTTRVVELSWLARCVVRPARPTAFNRCVCSPFLASVSLSAYRVFGNCRIQPGRSTGLPVTKLDSIAPPPPFDLPPFESNPLSFLLLLRFFFLSKPTALTNCFRSQFNANRPWRRIKRLWKDCYRNDWTSNISKKRVGRRGIIPGFLAESPLSDLLVILCLLTVYICVFAPTRRGQTAEFIYWRVLWLLLRAVSMSEHRERALRYSQRYRH